MVEQEMVTKALTEYHLTDAAIAKLRKDYMALTVKGIDDDMGRDRCHEGRMEIKSRRTTVEKTRKKLKEDSLEYGRAVDKEAKRITALLEPIEEYLLGQEKIVDDEKNRIKMEAENARIAAEISAKKAEEERLDKQRIEQEAEAKRLAAIAEAQRQKEANLKAKQDAIDTEEKRKADAIALEKAKAEAAEKARIETEERIKREVKDKTEADTKAKKEAARKEARLPDKEKIINFADQIGLLPRPAMKTEEGASVMLEIGTLINALKQKILEKAGKL